MILLSKFALEIYFKLCEEKKKWNVKKYHIDVLLSKKDLFTVKLVLKELRKTKF